MSSWASIAKAQPQAAPESTGLSLTAAQDGLRLLVVDANAIIGGLRLEGIADKAVTIQEVLDEIKDKQSRQFLAALPYKLEVSEPTEESVKAVTRFARGTGDISALSSTDIKLIALVHSLEAAAYGSAHLHSQPNQPQMHNKAVDNSQTLPGWGAVSNPEDWRVVDEANEEDEAAAAAAAARSSHIAQQVQQLNLDPSQPNSFLQDAAAPVAPATPQPAVASASKGSSKQQQQPRQQPAAAAAAAAHTGSGDDAAAAAGGDDEAADDGGWEVASKSKTAARHRKRKAFKRQQWKQAAEQEQEQQEDEAQPAVQQQQQQAPAAAAAQQADSPAEAQATAAAAVEADQEESEADDGEQQQQQQAVDSEEATNDELLAAEHQVFTTDELDPAATAAAATAADSSQQQQQHWQEVGGPGSPGWQSSIAIVTADFAMQNVLLQMGLRLLTKDGRRIARLSRYALRCSACFTVTREAGRLFCPKCGNLSLDRVEVVVGADGAEYFGVKKRHVLRGTRFSLPKPKGGRQGDELVLREDVFLQKVKALGRRAVKKKAGDDEDDAAAAAGGVDPFAPEYSQDTWHQPSQQELAQHRGLAAVLQPSWKNNPNERKLTRSNRRG